MAAELPRPEDSQAAKGLVLETPEHLSVPLIELYSHRIIELLRLEKTLNIIESNPNLTILPSL